MDISDTKKAVRSPCINVCELNDDNICSGCYRSLQEISAWSYASEDGRNEIVSNALQRARVTDG